MIPRTVKVIESEGASVDARGQGVSGVQGEMWSLGLMGTVSI